MHKEDRKIFGFTTYEDAAAYTPPGTAKYSMACRAWVKHWHGGLVTLHANDPYPYDLVYFTPGAVYFDANLSDPAFKDEAIVIINRALTAIGGGTLLHSALAIDPNVNDGALTKIDAIFYAKPPYPRSPALHGAVQQYRWPFSLSWRGRQFNDDESADPAPLLHAARYHSALHASGLTYEQAAQLRAIACKLYHYFEIATNDRQLRDDEKHAVTRLEERAQALVPDFPLIFNQDIRGLPIRIVLPDGRRSNAFHDEGYEVPIAPHIPLLQFMDE
jgi:hypothetical protein